MARSLLCAFALASFVVTSSPAFADKRVALVVGNSNYREVTKLPNAANDAKLIGDTLKQLGFTLVRGEALSDFDRRGLQKAIDEFGEELADADVGLFYYAGHGIQVRGSNYLVPIDASLTREADIATRLLNINQVLRELDGAGTKLKIIILDACRNDPFEGRSLVVARGRDNETLRVRDLTGGGGLAQMDAPAGTVISFATKPGSVAQDGRGNNSPYTQALAQTMPTPGLGILEMFNQVGLKVIAATGGAQQPWLSNSPISEPFAFLGEARPTGAAAAVDVGAEERAWDTIKTSDETTELRRFVQAFPGSTRKREVEQRIAALEQNAAAAQSAQAAARAKAAGSGRRLPLAKLLSPQEERTLLAGDAFKECSECPEMVAAPAGAFLMGSPPTERDREAGEGPQQQIVFRRMFTVGRFAVTFDEWNACVAEGGCNAYRPGDYGWGGGTRPVINVSWNDAQAYVKWLSAKTGAPYRLLSEAEREYVTRACISPNCPSTPFWFGPDISPAKANYDARFSYDGSPKTQRERKTVATDAAEPNPFGLLHMHGNVREWVEDCWNPNLAGIPRDGSPRRTGDCTGHVLRGGSWNDPPKDLRSAKRSWEIATDRRAQTGFRVARSLSE